MADRREVDWRRHAAVHCVSQLPSEPDDALRVLELARELVLTFLAQPAFLTGAATPDRSITPLPAGGNVTPLRSRE